LQIITLPFSALTLAPSLHRSFSQHQGKSQLPSIPPLPTTLIGKLEIDGISKKDHKGKGIIKRKEKENHVQGGMRFVTPKGPEP
jgi:hypothetical protein